MKELDVILPFRHSRWQDLELKYCLRGIEKHLTGVRKVVVVGDYPMSVSRGFTHLPYDGDDPSIVYKERNIYQKLRYGLENRDTTDDVIFFNDDHFITKDYVASEFPNYYDQWPVKSDVYETTYRNTKDVTGEDALFYDIHAPMVLNKKRFIEIMDGVDWDKKGGYCLKTLYANGLPGEEYKDLKIRVQYPAHQLWQMINGGYWFSMCDRARGNEIESVLKELYPEPSKYERVAKLTTA